MRLEIIFLSVENKMEYLYLERYAKTRVSSLFHLDTHRFGLYLLSFKMNKDSCE